MATRVVATATVRAMKNRKLAPARAALVLTPAAVNRVKQILNGQTNCVISSRECWHSHIM
jgi:hypothetical protein